MTRTRRGILIGGLVLALVIYAWQASENKQMQTVQAGPVPHVFGDGNVPIAKIRLRIFYAVPKNQSKELGKHWRQEIDSVLEEVKRFHDVQFHYASELRFDVYPEPVILERENLHYDTADTNYGNPEGLRRIVPELERRFPEFLTKDPAEFGAVAVIYEGVGAAGTRGSMILSRTFLTDAAYRDIRPSLFYHEFGHVLGLPDKYDLSSNQPFSNDIMGRGRFSGIDTNYIDPESIKEMGL